MGRKKNHAPGLGKSLIKDRFGKQSTVHLHAADLQAEEESDPNINSVTELTSLDDFLATAELAGTEFTAKRLNIQFVDTNKQGVLDEEESKRITKVQEEFQHLLQIPRRPKWDKSTTKEELDKMERELFLSWRRNLALLQEEEELLITPYEKNLEFWRQLWRVIERSDVIVQIVDARDPLLFRCLDLEAYVKELNPNKRNMILVNKADLLSSKQRQEWKKHFDKIGLTTLFWSAVLENEKLEANPEDLNKSASSTEEVEAILEEDQDLMTRQQLIDYFKDLSDAEDKIVVGMVGYPNVGKSSSVNTLVGVKRAAVSATPGRTKHFQTFQIDDALCLCDCPGLVFPSFVSNKAEMVLSGILPIDQMRDYVGPINLLSSRIPRKVIEVTYGINIAKPREGEDPDRHPTSIEILNAHALLRGFMTSHGQPDTARSARVILKDYVNGKLLCSRAPPGVDPDVYRSWTVSKVERVIDAVTSSGPGGVPDEMETIVSRLGRLNKIMKRREETQADDGFFRTEEIGTFSKDRKLASGKKHFNKKKEKMRRVRNVKY